LFNFGELIFIDSSEREVRELGGEVEYDDVITDPDAEGDEVVLLEMQIWN
jgi:hypothetical protein